MSDLDAQLRTFLQVAKVGSFRRAAGKLSITQAPAGRIVYWPKCFQASSTLPAAGVQSE